jgi:hypothetical protein
MNSIGLFLANAVEDQLAINLHLSTIEYLAILRN